MPHRLSPLLIFLHLLLQSLQISYAAFTESDIRGTYRLQLGASSCGDFISFSLASDKIPPPTIEMWKTDCPSEDSFGRRSCVGGRLNLQVDVEVGTAAQLFFGQRQQQIGTYLSGPCSARVRCYCRTFLEQNKVLLFIKPEADIKNVSWNQVFVGKSDIGEASSSGVYDFKRDVKYLMVGARCFYRQTADSMGPACFSRDARVLMEGGRWKRITEIATGDRVAESGGGGVQVIGWTHKEERGAWFWAAHLKGGGIAKATAGHLVEVKGEAGLETRVVRMGDVTVGMWMRGVGGDWRLVEKVALVPGWGLYNLQTMNGEVVVDGIVFTTYTEEVGVGGGHALLAPSRAAVHLLGGAGLGVEITMAGFARLWRWLLPGGLARNHVQILSPFP